MSVYNQQDSHQKYHDQTNFSFKQNQTKLTIKPKQSSSMIGKQKSKNKLKSKSQINIRKAPLFLQLNQQLNHLKYKVQTSKDILTTIYSKVKTKESILQNQLSKQNLQLYRANQVAQNYKKMYTDGLKLVQSCIDKRHSQNIKKNQNVLNTNKLVQLKINALQKIKQKRKFQQNINQDKIQYQVNKTQKNQQKSGIQSNASQSYFYQHKNIPKQTYNGITNKMKKSHSVINTTNKNFISDKQKKLNPKFKHSISQSQIQQENHKKPQQKILTFKQKQKQSQKQSMQKSMIRTERQKQKVQDQKTLYEIYKQRIQKRQKQQNSSKMSWIVDKLKQSIDDLQLIRKKSQIKLQKHSKSKSIQTQKQQKINEKSPQQLQIRKQKSKQKYLEIQKSKLRSINQSLA